MQIRSFGNHQKMLLGSGREAGAETPEAIAMARRLVLKKIGKYVRHEELSKWKALKFVDAWGVWMAFA